MFLTKHEMHTLGSDCHNASQTAINIEEIM